MSDDTPKKRLNDISPAEWDSLRHRDVEALRHCDIVGLLEQTLVDIGCRGEHEQWYLRGYESAIDDVISLIIADKETDHEPT